MFNFQKGTPAADPMKAVLIQQSDSGANLRAGAVDMSNDAKVRAMMTQKKFSQSSQDAP